MACGPTSALLQWRGWGGGQGGCGLQSPVTAFPRHTETQSLSLSVAFPKSYKPMSFSSVSPVGPFTQQGTYIFVNIQASVSPAGKHDPSHPTAMTTMITQPGGHSSSRDRPGSQIPHACQWLRNPFALHPAPRAAATQEAPLGSIFQDLCRTLLGVPDCSEDPLWHLSLD